MPSTALREVSLLQMLSESNHIVKCANATINASDHADSNLSHGLSLCRILLQVVVRGACHGA